MPDPRLRLRNLNTTQPLDWFLGNDMPQTGPAARVSDLMLLQKIYDGEWEKIADSGDYIVQDNLCALAIDRLTEIMMEYPPVFVNENDEEYESGPIAEFIEEFTPDLNEALRKGIRNFMLMGTAVLYNYEEEGRHRVAGVDPFWWFPGPGYEGDALLFPDDRGWKLIVNEPPRVTIYYFAFSDRLNYRSDVLPTINLGRMIGSAEEAAEYPERVVTSVARDPVYGEWGRSVLPATVPLMIEYNRIRSAERFTHKYNSFPGVLAKPRPGIKPDSTVQKLVINRAVDTEEADLVDHRGQPVSQRQENMLAGGGVFMQPEWADEMYVLNIPMNLDESNGYAEEIRRDLLTQFGLSPTVLGYQYGLERPSGESLREESAGTSTVTSYVQKKFIPAIKRAFKMAAAASGVAAEEVEVRWLLEMKRDENEAENEEGQEEGTEEAGEV